MLTATTHIVTVVIGAGVLALAWALAQLGWIAGIAIMLAFSAISIFTYNLVADCYRFPDPVTGKRNYTYMQAVKAYLGILHLSLLIIMVVKFLVRVLLLISCQINIYREINNQ